MTDRPILFSAPMVRALLAGRKTQTRRLLKPKKDVMACLLSNGWTDDYIMDPGNSEWRERYYPWRVSDRLYVREAFSGPHAYDDVKWPPRSWVPGDPIWYWADGNPQDGDWTRGKPGIHMPRWASRLTLAVTDVRVERLQAITKEDVLAEGCAERDGLPLVDVHAGWHEPYAALWDAINGVGAWESNPWIVAVSFRVAHHNIDKPLLIGKAA